MNTYGASSSAASRWAITRTLLVACVSAVLLAGCGGSSNQTGNVPDGNVTAAAPPQQGAQQPTSAQAAKAAKEKAAKAKAAKQKAAKAKAAKQKAAKQKAAKQKAAKEKAAKEKAAKAKAAKQQKKKKKKKVRYENCAAMRAAGAAPIKKGKPGYELRLDRDKDGYACELTK